MKLNPSEIEREVAAALREDVGSGDVTAELISPAINAKASIITREAGIMAGQPWVEAVFRQIDPMVTIYWLVNEGSDFLPNQTLCFLSGSARSLLTGERTALNFLQMMSGIATTVAAYVAELRHSRVKLLDTRKTLPGLRYAQKYAVACGGGNNHRMGLYDAFLIKENHIASCGSITHAVTLARKSHPEKTVEVEVENLTQFREARNTNCDIVLLDNFTVNQIREAVALNQGRIKLEISGGVNLKTLRDYATLGVDFISVGALTKHVRSIDLSMAINPLFVDSVRS